MHIIRETEKDTQKRVIKFFQDVLSYTYLGNWTDSVDENSNIIPEDLAAWLRRQNHDSNIINKAVFKLQQTAKIGGSRTLYNANFEVYELLRYGVKVLPEVGEQHQTVWLIDWKNPENNDFGIAEEVTIRGRNNKRPDLVLYINGIAIGVLELKRSIVSVSEGIRQNLANQDSEFIEWFFSTVQLVMAGNDTEGMRYGVIKTPEKHWLRWKEKDTQPDAEPNPLLRELSQFCNKERLLEVLHDFVVFDAGIKKICRHNQYYGVKAAQERVKSREGGIIWHTQGSGKSLVMVWLAKWILEKYSDARILIITDRTELDNQIEGVFKGVHEDIRRTQSCEHLFMVLSDSSVRLACSLVHKFRKNDEESDPDYDGYTADFKNNLPDDFHVEDNFFVFVDECHRTQSGKLHKAMTTLLNDAMLIGFTGTPLLTSDKRRSIETFGRYIDTYKYDEAVDDGVVLDLRYEARDIDQKLTSQERIDQFFDTKTHGLNDVAKARLKERWGTMLNVESSKNRLQKIVADIVLDMDRYDRLKSGKGNAMLVANSILSACRLYNLFQETTLRGKCAVITSYEPTTESIRLEETGEGLTGNQVKYNTYKDMLTAYFGDSVSFTKDKVDQFEREVQRRFIDEPAQMKLLIVVDKLLTGFDAPPATYLYIDKSMQDHGLFQAICRVNRIHTEDKEFGYIIDYKDLFMSLEQAITDYTGGAFDSFDKGDVEGLLKDRLEKGREQLEEAREAIKALCEPVDPPKQIQDYIRYFCSVESGNSEQIKANEQKRIKLYKFTAALVRAYANLANEMEEAGYTATEAKTIREEVKDYEYVRHQVKLASGDYIDLKMYEPDMRHLLDNYVHADDSELLTDFDNVPLVQLIVKKGAEAAAQNLPEGIRTDQEAMSAAIDNNIRRVIVDKTEVNPKYYEEMSRLLDELIQQRRQDKIDYQEYLSKVTALSKQVIDPPTEAYPPGIGTAAQQALFDNLGDDILDDHKAEIAMAIDESIKDERSDAWRGNRIKELEVRNAIEKVSDKYPNIIIDVDKIFSIAEKQDAY